MSFLNPKSDHVLLLKTRQRSHCPGMTVTPLPGMPCPHSQPHSLLPCPHPPNTPACHILRHSRALSPECLPPPAVSSLDLDMSNALLSPRTQFMLRLLGKASPSRKSNFLPVSTLGWIYVFTCRSLLSQAGKHPRRFVSRIRPRL